MRSFSRKLVGTLVLLGVLGSVTGAASWSAFRGESDNSGQTFSAGTVHVTDNDANAALFNLAGQKPGTVTSRCLGVTYSGSLGAEVRLFSDSTIGALGPYLNLTITPGTQTGGGFGDCTGFAADSGGALFDGTLAGFRASHNAWAGGLADQGPGGASTWTTNDTVVYRFSVSVKDDDAARNLSTGSHRFVVEAQAE